jgi:hypothetical protein
VEGELFKLPSLHREGLREGLIRGEKFFASITGATPLTPLVRGELFICGLKRHSTERFCKIDNVQSVTANSFL